MTKNQQINDTDLTDESTKIEEEGGMDNSCLDGGEVPKKVADEIEWLLVGELDKDPNQARKHIDDDKIDQLAESLKHQNMLQPILYKEVGDRRVIVSGERRWLAAIKAGLQKVPCRKVSDDAEVIALIENIVRENLLPMEEALAVEKLIREKKCKQAELGKKLGKAQNTISEILKLVQLPEYIKQEALSGPGWSRQTLLNLAKIPDTDKQEAEFAKIKEKLGQKSNKPENDVSEDEHNEVPAKASEADTGKRCPRAFNTSRDITQKLQNRLQTVLGFNAKQQERINEEEMKTFINELVALQTTIDDCLKKFSGKEVEASD